MWMRRGGRLREQKRGGGGVRAARTRGRNVSYCVCPGIAFGLFLLRYRPLAGRSASASHRLKRA